MRPRELWKSDAITGINIQDVIDVYKLRIWSAVSLYEENFPSLKEYITPYRISHTWKFMWYKKTIFQEGTHYIQIKPNNKYMIMEELIKGV